MMEVSAMIAGAGLLLVIGFLVGFAMRPDTEPTKGVSASTTDALIAPAFSGLCDDLRPGPLYIRPVPVPVPDQENHAPRDPKTGRYMKRNQAAIDLINSVPSRMNEAMGFTSGEPAGPISVSMPLTMLNAKITGIADEQGEVLYQEPR